MSKVLSSNNPSIQSNIKNTDQIMLNIAKKQNISSNNPSQNMQNIPNEQVIVIDLKNSSFIKNDKLNSKKNLQKSILKQKTFDFGNRKQGNTANLQKKSSFVDDDYVSPKLLINKHITIVLNKISKMINQILDSYYYILFMSIITIYVLFISDISSGFLTKEYDNPIMITQVFCFVLFSVELILGIIGLKDYTFSFFFWLDIISTISIIQDIDFMFDPFIALFISDSSNGNVRSATQSIVKAASAGKITRVLRVVRIIRLIRIVKLYKTTIQARNYMQKKKMEKMIKIREKERLKEEAKENKKKNLEIELKNIDQSPIKTVKEQPLISNSNRENMYNEHEVEQVDLRLNLDKFLNTESPKLIKNKEERSEFSIKPYKILNNNQNINLNSNRIMGSNSKEHLMNIDGPNNGNINQSPNQMQKPKYVSNKSLDFQLDIIDSTPKDLKNEKMEDMIKESNISKMISDQMTKKLIILILGMVLGLQIINEDNYIDSQSQYDTLAGYYLKHIFDKYSTNNLNLTNIYAGNDTSHFSLFKSNFTSEMNNIPIINSSQIRKNKEEFITNYNQYYNSKDEFGNFLQIYFSNEFFDINENTTLSNKIDNLIFIIMKVITFQSDETPLYIINITFSDINNTIMLYENITCSSYPYRPEEINVILLNEHNITIYKSNLYETQLTAQLNIGKTIFIMILIIIGAIDSEFRTKSMVLDPLEAMIEIVEMVEENPVIAKNAENLKLGIKQQLLNNESNAKDSKSNKKFKKYTDDNYEVIQIKNSIIKISALLSICFGEAGADMIKQNLQKGKEFNAMLEGKKKSAIFGFCDIRQFPIVNEALQEKTMIFVNQISEIVHSSIDRFSGATNKNIGDSYLSAWRFVEAYKDNKNIVKMRDLELSSTNPKVNKIADQSILGFLQIILKINSEKDILSYRNDKDIKSHHELTNYKVKMGFGLHVGWGIEGAIGSNNKIDASYLSPNVNISARLKEATKQYGVYLLISGELYSLCSNSIKNICRLIDKVEVKGSKQPIELYTVDVNIHNLPKDNSIKLSSAKKRYEKFIKVKRQIHLLAKNKGGIVEYTLNSKGFKSLLKIKRHSDFLLHFNKGILSYLEGDWIKAEEELSICKDMDPNDGPTKNIYTYIKNYNFNSSTCETKWNGYRSLTSK